MALWGIGRGGIWHALAARSAYGLVIAGCKWHVQIARSCLPSERSTRDAQNRASSIVTQPVPWDRRSRQNTEYPGVLRHTEYCYCLLFYLLRPVSNGQRGMLYNSCPARQSRLA